jgi:hypothetical protein
MDSHLIRHFRLAWHAVLLFALAATAPAASPETPKPLPRYKHYYPDAQYHLAKSDDRLVPGLDHDQYCVQKSSDGYDLAFIEFDQRGDFWDRDQLAIARHQLKARLKPGEKPLLLEYVHGWHHNAQEDEHRDVKGFRALLSYLSHSQYLKDKHYHVFGVYIGWRGEQWRSGGDPIGYASWLPSQLSFYPEKHIGSLVGSMPMVTEALFWMVNTARDASPDGARTVLIGHSFGAMVLENAIAQAVASSSAMNPGKGAPVNAPADLILLLNSAADSLHAKGVTEMLDRMGKAGSSRFVDPKRPLIISVTSTGDWATGKFFPLGTGLSNITKAFRSYQYIGKDKHNTLPEGTTQRDFVTTTPGHNDLLLSHLVHIDADRIAPTTRQIAVPPTKMTSNTVFEQNLSDPLHPQNSGTKTIWPFRSLAKDGTSCRSEIAFAPDARMRTAYWIMRVPPQIIYDHGDIFNEQALCLYAALFRIENPTGKKLPPGPRKMQMAPPVIPSAASGTASPTKIPNG